MATILRLEPPRRPPAERPASIEAGRGEIVIFPGVRIERHDIDLGHRVRKTVDRSGSPSRRPRKTS